MEGSTTTTGGIKYVGLLRFPKHFWLLEHDMIRAVIRVDKAEELSEVETLCRAAIRNCDHTDLGPCMSIKPATMDDWLEYH